MVRYVGSAVVFVLRPEGKTVLQPDNLRGDEVEGAWHGDTERIIASLRERTGDRYEVVSDRELLGRRWVILRQRIRSPHSSRTIRIAAPTVQLEAEPKLS